jgi:predicted ATPase
MKLIILKVIHTLIRKQKLQRNQNNIIFLRLDKFLQKSEIWKEFYFNNNKTNKGTTEQSHIKSLKLDIIQNHLKNNKYLLTAKFYS